MAANLSLRSPQVVALVALTVAFIAILQVRTTFALSAYSTYDATSSVTIFRNAIVVTAVCYALSFLTRWFVLPGMLAGVFASLAMVTFLLGPASAAGSASQLALTVALISVFVALWKGVSILRPRRAAPVA